MIRLLIFFICLNLTASDLLREKCIDCHNPDKRKGQFNLNSLFEKVPNTTELLRAYKAILKNEMPPKKKLSDSESLELITFLRNKQQETQGSRYLTPDEIKNTFSDIFDVDTHFNPVFNSLSKYLKEMDFSTIESKDYMSSMLLKSLQNILDNSVSNFLYLRQSQVRGYFQDDNRSVYYPTLFPVGSTQVDFLKMDLENRTFDLRGKQTAENGRLMFNFKWGVDFSQVHYAPGLYEVTFEVTARNRENIIREKRTHLVQNHRLLNEKSRLNLYIANNNLGVVSNHSSVRKLKQIEVPDNDFLKVKFLVDMKSDWRLMASFENGLDAYEISHIFPHARPNGAGPEVWEMPDLHFKNSKVTRLKNHYPILHKELRTKENIVQLLNEFSLKSGMLAHLEEIQVIYRHYLKTMDQDNALDTTIKSVLSSDRFLYLKNDTPQEKVRWASYSLLKSPPDESFIPSFNNRKKKPKDFAEFIINNKKFRRFTDQFINEFIGLKNIQRNRPSLQNFFYYYANDLENYFDKEVKLYFYNMFKNNRPVSELIDSNYSYLNDELLKFYLDEEKYSSDVEFKKVFFKKRRGGIINTGAFMTATANGIEGLPFRRSKWYAENCLDVKLPPPPINIDLENIDKSGLSFSENIKLHSSNKKCFSCHKHLDDSAIYFHQFNPTGKKIHPLPKDQQVEKISIDNSKLALSFCVKLISFATGRKANISDYKTAREILDRNPDPKTKDLFHEIIKLYFIK